MWREPPALREGLGAQFAKRVKNPDIYRLLELGEDSALRHPLPNLALTDLAQSEEDPWRALDGATGRMRGTDRLEQSLIFDSTA